MKIFSVLAEFVLWELSIVSSLSLYSILVQHACNDHGGDTRELQSRMVPPPKKTGSSHLKEGTKLTYGCVFYFAASVAPYAR